MGLAFGWKIDKRIGQIKAFEAIMAQLGFQMGFLSVPFGEALLKASASQRGAVRGLMESTAGIMNNQPDISAGEAFEGALRHGKDGIYMSNRELDIIREFMVQAGKADLQRTMDGIKVTSAKLKLAREENESRRSQDGKMYKGLGFMTGIFIVVLLI